MNCPSCGFDNLVEARYCGMCGTRLAHICSACGHTNPGGYRYCIRCGAPLSVEVPITQQLAGVETKPSTVEPPARPIPEATVTPSPPATTETEIAILEGERRVATIILADVQGSTDLLEQVGTEAWVEMMNHVFQLLEAEIYRFDGRVDQFRGDGLVAFFGTATAHEDDPERGVLAAMGMQRAIRDYATDLAKEESIDLSLRVGVNTGEVIVTSVGDADTYSENTAMGEAIAVAARMEQAAEPGTVLVSENTYRLVEGQFDWLNLGEIRVKGVSRPIHVYRPLASRISSDRSHDYDYEATPPLIGRERELQELITAIDELRAGRGGIVAVTGERGMGKSLLVNEMRRRIVRQEALLAEIQGTESTDGLGDIPDAYPTLPPTPPPSNLRIRELQGRARSYDQSQPYATWQELLRNWVGIRADQPPESARDRLREKAEELWGRRVIEVYPDLARFLGLPLEPAIAEQISHIDAEGLRQRVFLTIRSWIEELAQQGPLILTFNDMHWADTTSLDLVRYCLPLCEDLSLMWLFVFRPDRLSAVWEFQHYLETEYPHRLQSVTLAPFDAAQSQALIEYLIGPNVLPEETQALIIQKAEGNPFFTQELVRSLIANGTLVHTVTTDADGDAIERWEVAEETTKLSLPDSLQGLLMARIDRLAPAQQQVLQRAAVIGAIFWSKVLQAISVDLPELPAHLTSLQRAQLIVERGRSPSLGIEYGFKSRLVRDAAYDSLLSSQRVAYHHRIAEYLETRFEIDAMAQDQGHLIGTLAHHYQHASRPAKELYYTLKNAEHAKAIFANAEASQYYTHALELIDRLTEKAKEDEDRRQLKEQRFQVLMGRHQVYYLMAEFEEMRCDAAALLPLARELSSEGSGDPTWLIDALLHQPGVGDHHCRDEVRDGQPMAEEALALAREIGDKRREIECLVTIINQKLALSDPDWHQLAESALDLAREISDHYYEARLLVGMGSIFAFSDQPERSMEYLEAAAALAMSEGLEDKVVQMSLLNLLGLEYERNGDYYRLLTEYQQERLHASREIGHRPMESQALQACGRIAGIYLGDYPAALSALDECYRILEGSRDLVYPLLHITQIHLMQAELSKAQQTLEEIHRIGEPPQDRAKASLMLVEAMRYNAQGVRAATRGEHKDVSQSLTLALRHARKVVALAEASPLVSQQYEMAAHCKATVACLGLAQSNHKPDEQAVYLSDALDAARRGYEIYQHFGFAQIVECVSEEVFFRYSQALAANQLQELAVRFLRRAYDEMMHKYSLIPPDSHFRRTYLEHIPLHREIKAAYATRVGSILTEASQIWQQAENTTSSERVI